MRPRAVAARVLRLTGMTVFGLTGAASSLADEPPEQRLATIEQAAAAAFGPERQAWLERVKSDQGGFERSLDALIARGDGERALRFASALSVFLTAFGELTEARARLDAALAVPGAAAPTPVRAKALYDAGLLAFRRGDEPASRARNEESLAIGRRLGDQATIARALIGLSRIALRRHDYDLVRRDAGEALALGRELDDRPRQLSAIHMLAAAARMAGDNRNAQKYYELTLGAYGAEGDRLGVAGELMNLGFVHLHEHDLESAAQLFRDSVATYRALQSDAGLAWDIGGFAALAAERHDGARAARLFGALESAMERSAIVLDPDDQLDFDRYVSMAREQLGAPAFEAARALGRQMSTPDALALGMQPPK